MHSDALDEYEAKTGIHIDIHVDAASGGERLGSNVSHGLTVFPAIHRFRSPLCSSQS